MNLTATIHRSYTDQSYGIIRLISEQFQGFGYNIPGHFLPSPHLIFFSSPWFKTRSKDHAIVIFWKLLLTLPTAPAQPSCSHFRQYPHARSSANFHHCTNQVSPRYRHDATHPSPPVVLHHPSWQCACCLTTHPPTTPPVGLTL